MEAHSDDVISIRMLKLCDKSMGGGGGQKSPNNCHTYSTMMKLGTVIPYLKEIQNIYKSSDTPLEFC